MTTIRSWTEGTTRQLRRRKAWCSVAMWLVFLADLAALAAGRIALTSLCVIALVLIIALDQRLSNALFNRPWDLDDQEP